MTIFHALRIKGNSLQLECKAETPEGLDKKIEESHRLWAAFQPRGAVRTLNDYLADKERVKITIEKI